MKRLSSFFLLSLFAIGFIGCKQQSAAPQGPAMQAMPVQTVSVSFAPVANGTDYVSTIKSRRSATLQPQVNGRLIGIQARSGDHVKSGQTLMTIDAEPQIATVAAQEATEAQKKALFDYDAIELERQRKLFEAGVTSRDTFDQAQQAYSNAKADYNSAVALRKTQQEQLNYYTIRAPFDGVVGDIPVHVGDYVSSTTMLTTVDENRDLEAYIYIPTDRASEVKIGLPVELFDTAGTLLEKTKVDFVSPQVDPTLQGVLVKAPVHAASAIVRTSQLIKVRVIWNSTAKAEVPVLAVSRQSGQAFVFVAQEQGGKYFARQRAITVGDTLGNNYAVESGLKEGEKVIVSGTQILMDGVPVVPLPASAAQGAPGTGI